jgi:predicted NUDIX family phosphoesterase
VSTFPKLHQQHADHELEPFHHLSTIALIRTLDGHYLFGRRSRNGEVDLIGGGVQCDELAVTCGADLERNLFKEIHEEVGIREDDIEQLAGIGILLSGTSNVLIVAHANLALTRAEAAARFAMRTDNEMSEPVFVRECELCPMLRAMSDYRRLIPELI